MTITARPGGARPSGACERQRIVVDASNVCTASRDDRGRPRLPNLIAVRATLAKLGFDVTIICDANLKYGIDSPDGLQSLISRGEVLQVPAGTDGDVYILDAAARLGARVLSNDVFRQHVGRFPWIAERRVPFMLIADQVLIPDLAVGAARPLCGVEESADSSEGAAVTLTAEPDRRRSLLQGLVDENEAL